MHHISESQKSFLEITASLRYLLYVFFKELKELLHLVRICGIFCRKISYIVTISSLEKAIVECHLHSHV